MKSSQMRAAVVVAMTSAMAQAGQVTIDLSGIVDSDLTAYTNGWAYPGPGITTIGGVTFDLARGANGATWVAGGLATGGGTVAYTVGGLDIGGVIGMYALINSAFGVCGSTVGAIGASSGGSSASFALVEGENVRDHFQGGFCNTATDVLATADYGSGVRFDMYRFDLSALTAGGINPITAFSFLATGSDGWPLLAAVTFETHNVPEPGTMALMLLGVAGLALSRLRRSPGPRTQ